MFVYRLETVVTQDGVLTVKGIPFRAGEKVEVIITSLRFKSKSLERYPLRGKPFRYTAPYESVATNDWEVLK